MKLKTIHIRHLAGLLAGFLVAAGLAFGAFAASEEEGATPHYPLKHPKHAHWNFAGFFGKWDIGQLQRGLKVYVEVCASCHSLDYVAFRNLEDLGYTPEQVKTFAAEYTVEDGPDSEGEMFERPARPSDYFPSPYANSQAAAAANNGAPPPDFSLLAKARAPTRGFPTFLIDLVWGANGGPGPYAENGPDYIYSLMTGYEDAPAGHEVPEGAYYNPYFISGDAIAMAPPIEEGLVTYDDGAPETVDQYSRDISAFLMWAAEPNLVERKKMGFVVMLFLALLAVLLYLTKNAIFAGLKGVPEGKSADERPATAAIAAGGAVAAVATAAPAKAAKKPAKKKKAKKKDNRPTAMKKPTKPDDLKMISGVGPKLEGTLNGLGVYKFAQIAKWKKAEVDWVNEYLSFKGRIERDEWIKQAKALTKSGSEE